MTNNEAEMKSSDRSQGLDFQTARLLVILKFLLTQDFARLRRGCLRKLKKQFESRTKTSTQVAMAVKKPNKILFISYRGYQLFRQTSTVVFSGS